jgi:large subunit ribosomal protein L4
MDLAVFNVNGEDTGRKITLNESIFGVTPNDHAIYLDVKQILANRRQGTHKTKERSEVAGSTRKIKKQKGTGSARFGDIKNPIFRGGGRMFGPRPRDYSFKLNKKVKQLARKSALAYKAVNQQILVVEDFNLETPKTKEIYAIHKNLKINDKKLLIVLKDKNNNVYLSSRNLQDSKVVTISDLNTYDIMNAATLLFVESSLDALQEKVQTN